MKFAKLFLIVILSLIPLANLGAIKKVQAAVVLPNNGIYRWPTTGYVGYKYNQPINYYVCNGKIHKGVDIWTNTSGTGNNGTSKGNPVYPITAGTVESFSYLGDTKFAVIIKHDDGKWSHYYHMASESTSYIEPSLLPGTKVNQNTLLGYQGDLTGTGDKIVHLDLVISSSSKYCDAIDPSPYFDVNLNANVTDDIPFLGSMVEYSPIRSKHVLFGDINHDGKKDAVVVKDSGVNVNLSDGTKFIGGAYKINTPYYGKYGTYLADVTGDGYEDLIAVNELGINVRPSYKSSKSNWGFKEGGYWSQGAFYGNRGTYFADVTGDKRADAIALNDHGIYVKPANSKGTAFLTGQYWLSSSYYGSKGTYFADVTGDSKADAIAVNDTGIYVKPANSSKKMFTTGKYWIQTAYYGNVETFFADVTGDKRADAIAINKDGIHVKPALSTQKLDTGRYIYTGSYYGGIRTYVENLAGDKKADFVAVNQYGIHVKTTKTDWKKGLNIGGYWTGCSTSSCTGYYGEYGPKYDNAN